MLKYLGLFMLFACVVGFGRLKAAHYRKSHRILCEITGLVGRITSRIEFYNSPLHEIYRSESGGELSEFVARLRNGESFETSLDVLYGLDGDVRSLLGDFGRTLGRLNREEQLRSCGYTLEMLKKSTAESAAELGKRVKLCETLSLLFAATLLILFL